MDETVEISEPDIQIELTEQTFQIEATIAGPPGPQGDSAPRVSTIASSATPTIDTDTTDVFVITALTTAITSMSANLSGTPTEGQKLLVQITDNGTPWAITWGESFASSGVAALLSTTVAGKTHLVGLIYNATAGAWACMACDSNGY